MLVLTPDLRVKSANQSFYQTFCVTQEETSGRVIFELGNGQWNIPKLRQLLEELLPHNDSFNDFEVEHDFENIGHRVMRLNARRLDDQEMILLAIEDATEREKTARELRELTANLEQRVTERTEQVKALTSPLTMAEEQERRRIAQVLHDDLQQQLYGILMKTKLIRDAFDAGDHEGLVKEIEKEGEWLEHALKITRELTVELSPPGQKSKSLAEAVDSLARQMKVLHGLEVDLKATDDIRVEDDTVRGLLYQIVRELLFNVVKHAGVDKVAVELSQENSDRVIRVVDEGRGFVGRKVVESQQREAGFGLLSVKERLNLLGGRVDIDTAPEKGTHVPTTLSQSC